jgi:hypothetical protein
VVILDILFQHLIDSEKPRKPLAEIAGVPLIFVPVSSRTQVRSFIAWDRQLGGRSHGLLGVGS